MMLQNMPQVNSKNVHNTPRVHLSFDPSKVRILNEKTSAQKEEKKYKQHSKRLNRPHHVGRRWLKVKEAQFKTAPLGPHAFAQPSSFSLPITITPTQLNLTPITRVTRASLSPFKKFQISWLNLNNF